MNLGLGLRVAMGSVASGVQSFIAGALQQFHTRASQAWHVDMSLGTNKLLQSDDLTNVAWVRQTMTMPVAVGGAPVGQAFRLTANGTFSQVRQSRAVQPGETFTISAVAQYVDTPVFSIVQGGAGWGVTSVAQFNLQTGAVVGYAGADIAGRGIIDLGGGWYRCWLAMTAPVGATTDNTGLWIGTYTGTDFSGKSVLVAAPQCNPGIGPDPYRATTTSALDKLVTSPANVLRVLPSPAGVMAALREPASTNVLTNSTAAGAVAGTPGTAPTGWSMTPGATGIGWNVVGTGTDSGIPYVDMRLSGTNVSGGTAFVPLSLGPGTAAASGQAWTLSAYIRQIAGSTAGLTWNSNEGLRITQSAGSSIHTGVDVRGAGAGPLGTSRFTVSITADAAATSVGAFMQFPVAAGGTVDCTFRVGLPQLEQLPFATQPIPTSGAAVTRARDEIALPRATAAGEAYSAVVDFCLPNLPPAGAGSEAKLLTTNPTGVVTPLAISPTGSLWSWNGTAGSAGTSNLYTAGTRGKAGFVSYPTGHSRSLNGGSIVWSAGLSFPAGTEMRLAQTGNTDTQCAPTYLHEFRVYSRILTDPELVAATV